MSVNRIILIGNVGKDPEVKQVNSTSVANFSIATSETYKNKDGEKVTNTDWHNINAWGNLAEIIEKYVKKGDKLYIEGSSHTRSYEKDGITRYVTEVKCSSIQMLGGGKVKEEPAPEKSNADYTDDLPY